MAIQIDQALTQPQVTFDRVHLTNMVISQPIFEDNLLVPKYTIEVSFRIYGLDGDTRIYDKGDVRTVVIEDFVPLAMAQAAIGDTRLVGALQGIESGVAAILTTQLGMTAVLVS